MMRLPKIEYRDVTDALLSFTDEALLPIMTRLSERERRFVHDLVWVVQAPQEIWQQWEKAPKAGEWQLARYYLRFLSIEETDFPPFAVVMTQFLWERRWRISDMRVWMGQEEDLMPQINQTIRCGRLVFPPENT